MPSIAWLFDERWNTRSETFTFFHNECYCVLVKIIEISLKRVVVLVYLQSRSFEKAVSEPPYSPEIVPLKGFAWDITNSLSWARKSAVCSLIFFHASLSASAADCPTGKFLVLDKEIWEICTVCST